VERGRGQIQDRDVAVGGGAAGLLDDVGHRHALVQDPEKDRSKKSDLFQGQQEILGPRPV